MISMTLKGYVLFNDRAGGLDLPLYNSQCFRSSDGL